MPRVTRPVSLSEQLGLDRSQTQVFDFSNTRRSRPRRTLTNAEAIEALARFLRTGDVRHLPRELRAEREGIRALVSAAAAGPDRPWPAGAAHPQPGPGASLSELIRALAGDEAADADSGLEDGAA